MAIQNLEVDLDLKQNLNIYATCKQLDNLTLICNIYDNSTQADLSNYNVRLKALKSDKVALIQETSITVSNNIVTIVADEQLTTTSGKTLIELQFINKTSGLKKATFNLILIVVASTVEVNATISTSTYTLLQELENKLDQASDFFENIDEAIEANTDLINSTNTANSTKQALDSSNTTALATKSALDTSNTNATNTKNALDTLNTTANNTKNSLSAINTTGQTLLNSLETFEQEHADVSDISNQLANINADLSEKAKQSDLDATNVAVATNTANLASNTAKILANTTAIATKADTSYVDGLVGDIGASAIFKGKDTNANILALTGMSVGDEWYDTTNSTYLRYNGTSWIDIGTDTKYGVNSVSKDMLQNNSVTPKKTNFFKVGKNLFNKATASIGYYINYQTGVLTANVQYDASDYIEVKPSTQYTMVSDTTLRICYYDVNKVFISGSNVGVQTITTPSNCYYIRYSFTISTLNTQQFEEGATPTTYEAYTSPYLDTENFTKNNSMSGNKLQDNTVSGGKLIDNTVSSSKLIDNDVSGSKLLDNSVSGSKLEDDSVTFEKTVFFELDTSLNLFDGNYSNVKLTGNTGSLQFQNGDSLCKTAIIPISPNTTYSFIRNTSSRLNYGTATKLLSNLQFIDGSINSNSSQGSESTTPTHVTFTSGANDIYLYINVTITGKDVFLQVVEGEQTELTINSYPVNPKGINVYNKYEVYNKSEIDTKLVTNPNNTFNKVGSVCTIKTGKAQYTFKRVTDTSINVDAWRLYDGTLINPEDNSIIGLMWSNSDAEGAIQIHGESDFVSGYHGDEIFSAISILVDGVLIDIDTDYENLNFSNLTIISESAVYHCNTSASAGVQAFSRVKTLTFENNTVKINNRYVCSEDLLINRAAIALFNCYKTYNSTKFFTHYSNNNDLKLYIVPDVAEYSVPPQSSKMTEVCFYTTIGTIDFKINKGQENQYYIGYINNFSDQNRMKIYFDYIKTSTSGTQVYTGDILQTEFQFTIK